MASFYQIEQQFLREFNLPTRWADYDEELDHIYMTKIYPLIMKHFDLITQDEENTQTKTKNIEKQKQIYNKNPFALLLEN